MDMNASISAVNAASSSMNVVAHNVANLNTENFTASRSVITQSASSTGVDQWIQSTATKPDMVTQQVMMINAANYMRSNVAVIQLQNEAMGTLVDLLA